MSQQKPEIKTLFSFNTKSAQLQGSYMDVVLKKNNAFITGFVKDDSMFVLGHGTKTGGIIAANDFGIGPKFLGSILQEEGLIPKNVKNIYTISCYGGLQQPFELADGVKIQPIHTSKQKVKFGLQLNNNNITLSLGVTNNAELTEAFKERFKVQNGDKIDVNLAFTSEDFNKAFMDNKARHGALTPQEAFDRYGPDDDRFFTSQGLDPAEQKAKLEKLKDKYKKADLDVKAIPSTSSTNKTQKEPIKNSTQQTKEVKKTSEQVSKSTVTDSISKTPNITKNTSPKISKKSLSGGGKLAIGLTIAAATGAVVANKIADSKAKKTKNTQSDEEEYDNSYAQQMAADISSYKYGKHMTGFVNF